MRSISMSSNVFNIFNNKKKNENEQSSYYYSTAKVYKINSVYFEDKSLYLHTRNILESLVENRFDSQSRGSFVLSADDLKVHKVYFKNSTYYGFNEKNELIAELILNPDDFDQSIKNNDVMEAMNNFFMDIVKAKEQLEDEGYEKRKEIRKKLKEILN